VITSPLIIIITGTLFTLMLHTALMVHSRSGWLVSIITLITAIFKARMRLLAALHTIVLTGAFRWRGTQRSLASGGFLSIPFASEARRVVRLSAIFRGVTMSSASLAKWTAARTVVAIVEVMVGVPTRPSFVVTLPLAQLRAFITLRRRSARA
jgi:hypothetical protein